MELEAGQRVIVRPEDGDGERSAVVTGFMRAGDVVVFIRYNDGSMDAVAFSELRSPKHWNQGGGS